MPVVTLPATPPPPRVGRVVLDATDGPMRVSAKYDPSFVPPGGSVEQGRSGELCVTPCVVDLPVGKYRLFLSAPDAVSSSRGDTDDLVVAEGVQIYRRAPGLYRTPSPIDALGPAAVFVASVVMVIGGAALAQDSDKRGLGTGVAVGGLVGGVLGGVWAYDASRARQQDGATTSWQTQR